MTQTNQQYVEILTPLGLLGSFVGMFSAVSREVITIRGVYKCEGSREYTSSEFGGHWFDGLADEHAPQKIALIVPSRLRLKLEPERCVTLRGYVHPKVVKSGIVEVRVVVTQVTEQKKREINPLEMARFEVLRNRTNIPFLDVDALLRQALSRGQKPKLVMICGEAAVVMADVQKALRTASQSLEMIERRVPLSSPEGIARALHEAALETPILIALVTGGGEHLKVFDDPHLGDAILESNVPVIAALGHANDVPLAAQVAERAFSTPTALGDWLFHLVDDQRQLQFKVMKEAEETRTLQTEIQNLKARVQWLPWIGLWGVILGMMLVKIVFR
jgi:exodeoxyribonuclease VII large subunit